jgi:hypothetical protein
VRLNSLYIVALHLACHCPEINFIDEYNCQMYKTRVFMKLPILFLCSSLHTGVSVRSVNHSYNMYRSYALQNINRWQSLLIPIWRETYICKTWYCLKREISLFFLSAALITTMNPTTITTSDTYCLITFNDIGCMISSLFSIE